MGNNKKGLLYFIGGVVAVGLICLAGAGLTKNNKDKNEELTGVSDKIKQDDNKAEDKDKLIGEDKVNTEEELNIENSEKFKKIALRTVKEISTTGSIVTYTENDTKIKGMDNIKVDMFSLRKQYNKINNGFNNTKHKELIRDRINQSVESQVFTVKDNHTVVQGDSVKLTVEIMYNSFNEDYLNEEWHVLRSAYGSNVPDDEITEKVLIGLEDYLNSPGSLEQKMVSLTFTKAEKGWEVKLN